MRVFYLVSHMFFNTLHVFVYSSSYNRHSFPCKAPDYRESLLSRRWVFCGIKRAILKTTELLFHVYVDLVMQMIQIFGVIIGLWQRIVESESCGNVQPPNHAGVLHNDPCGSVQPIHHMALRRHVFQDSESSNFTTLSEGVRR